MPNAWKTHANALKEPPGYITYSAYTLKRMTFNTKCKNWQRKSVFPGW